MLKHWRQFAVPGTLVIYVALMWWWASSGYPTQAQTCEPTQTGDNCSSQNLLFAFVWYAIHELDRYAVLITGVATATVAYFTWIIKRINRTELDYAQQVERAYISGGGVPHTRYQGKWMGGVFYSEGGETPMFTGAFELHINNYGKTPGELWEVGIGFCDASDIPERPDYNRSHYHDWIAPGTGSRPIALIPIPEDIVGPAIYGRFYYQDIFRNWHSSGFIQSIGTTGETSPLLAPAVYTEERDED